MNTHITGLERPGVIREDRVIKKMKQ